MKILMLHRQQSSVGYYRTHLPARALRKAGHEVTVFDKPYAKALKPNPVEWMKEHINDFDLLIVDRSWKHEETALHAGFRHYSEGMRMIVDFDDDFTNVPWWNPAHSKYQPGQEYREAGLNHLKLSEMTTVSTPTLAERFKNKAHAIECLPNMIDPDDWTEFPVNPAREKDVVYIMYGGANGHFGDLDEVKEGLTAVLKNPPAPIRLICFGSAPGWLHDIAKEHPGRVISLPWIPSKEWPKVTSWGGFDIAIAPLADHPFNEAKSNIKYLESSLQNTCFVCSDVGPYQDIPDECALKLSNTPAQWASGLREMITNKALRTKKAQLAKEDVLAHHTVDNSAQKWHNTVQMACSRPRITCLEDTHLPSDPAPLEPETVPKEASQGSSSLILP